MTQEIKHPGAKANPFYVARSQICLDSAGKSIGDGVFAGSNYKGGEFISALKRPLVGSLDTERLKDTCANCFTWTQGSSIGSRLYVQEGTKVETCAGCKRFRYCSKACQKEAWKRGHKHECKSLESVAGREIPKAVLACMEILIRRKHGLIPDQAWEMLCRLDTHIDDFKQDGKYEGIELMAKGAGTFSHTQDTFDQDFVAGMYGRILSNSLTLVTPTYDPLGIMIDPSLGHINHSCDPNAYVVMDGPEVELRTLRDIKKDEEIYISYIDTTNPYARRQSELRERWFFNCQCPKCQKGATGQEDQWLIKPEELPDKFKEVADLIIEKTDFANDPVNYVGDTLDERRVAAIQGEVFRVYEDQQRAPSPAEAIELIESGMGLCAQSGLWPPHRQPMAALRDDLIVNMLSVKKYEIAWAQCAKRDRYISSVLYPQRYHPVRVVQMWQMATLAQYLASEGCQFPPEVDMAVIAAILISAVFVTAPTSHGPNSAFARSVERKVREVEAEIISKFGSKKAADEAVKVQGQYLLQMGDWIKY